VRKQQASRSGWPDGYIAAIAKANGMTVTTRDTHPFDAAGVPFVNPWEARSLPT